MVLFTLSLVCVYPVYSQVHMCVQARGQPQLIFLCRVLPGLEGQVHGVYSSASLADQGSQGSSSVCNLNMGSQA